MEEIVINKLREYIRENNPDLLLKLERENKVAEYLQDKVSGIDITAGEEISMDQLTEDLRPSKYNYILSLLEDEFPKEYETFLENNVLLKEAVNMVFYCEPLLEEYHFSNNDDDNFLRYAVTGSIKEYLDGAE